MGGGPPKGVTTLPGFEKEKMEKVKKGKNRNSEVVMRKNMQWWGFLEMLGFDQNPGGTQVTSDESRQEPMVHRKSRFGFKRRSKGVEPMLLTEAVACSHTKGGDSSDISLVAEDEVQDEAMTPKARMAETGDSSSKGRVSSKEKSRKRNQLSVRDGNQAKGSITMLISKPLKGGIQMKLGEFRSEAAVNESQSTTLFKKGGKAMKTGLMSLTTLFAAVCLFSFSSAESAASFGQRYDCEEDLIEVMFAQDSKVRLRAGTLVDLETKALAGVDQVLAKAVSVEWHRICDVPEERLDEIHARGEENSGKPIYNLNNVYRLRITNGEDVWTISRELEALPGVMFARPVPKPAPPPWPGYYEPQQGYLDPASSTPTGIDAKYAWGWWPGGDGAGVTVCDLEYSWNYNHGDITKAPASQINSNVVDPHGDTNHGTAVIGELVSDKASWGTTGICYNANLKTCGTYFGSPSPSWNPAGAVAVAIASLSAGDVILLEQQWDYDDPGTAYTDYIPIEWWTDTYPDTQSYNAVYVAIENATANGIHVVECGGNGGAPGTDIGYNTDNLTWHGNSGAIIVGAGGIKTAGQYPEGDLERLCFSSYGSRFDLQGWGEEVVTTGYGHLWIADGINYAYTDSFAGTSSAAPIVAGAVACCVGYWKNYVSPALPSPEYIRNLLIATGTPQVNPGTGHIGPRPDLLAAINAMYQAYYWVDASTSPLDDAGGYGCAWGDYDNDGDLDLYVSRNNYGNFLHRNDGGGTFTRINTTPPYEIGDGTGIAWGDYDNDGDLDLYLAQANGQPNELYRNDGSDVFTDVTNGLPLGDAGDTYGAAWGDYDKDGDIDLYIANYNSANKLLRNDGASGFTDATGGTPLGDAGFGVGVAWGDYDNDGDLDLYLSNGASTANKLFRNDGGGSFTDVTAPPLDDAGTGMGVAWGDYDNDGDLDLYLANSNGANKLIRNNGGGSFSDATSGPLGDGGYGYGCAWGDYDNDGDLDLYLANGGSTGDNRLFRNDGSGTFTDAASPLVKNTGPSTGVAWGDYDGDGDIDLYVTNNNPYRNKLFRNEIGTSNHWLHINLVGTTCNVSAIGARVRVVAGGVSQTREISGGSGMCSQNSLTAEFGLGFNVVVDTLQVQWPSAKSTDTYTNLPVDTLLTLYQGGLARGDANGDGVVNIGDVVFLVTYLYRNGPAPNPVWVGDANSDGVIDVGDIVYLVAYLYRGGPPPCAGAGGGSPANTAKLSAGFGQAKIWARLKTGENTAASARTSGRNLDRVFEISVMGSFDQDVAGIQLEIDFDPDQVTMLDPVLSPLTNGLQLFAGVKDGTQRIGIVDLSGKNFLPPGEGALVTLRARGNDLSSVNITRATLVDMDSRPLALELSGELNLEAAKCFDSRPQGFSLSQNYPNPFNPRTSIRYALPQDAEVRLTVYNVLGQRVATLVDEYQSAGYSTVWWDGKDANGDEVSSGVYFYRLTAGEFSEVKKMMMVK